jgi:hypothetical protein
VLTVVDHAVPRVPVDGIVSDGLDLLADQSILRRDRLSVRKNV